MPLLSKQPERTIKGWTHSDTIRTARAKIEDGWRLITDDENLRAELVTLVGHPLLSGQDVDGLIAYARALGDRPKTSDYQARFREGRSFIVQQARSTKQDAIRGRLLELDDDRTHLIGLARALQSDPSLVL